MSWAAMLYFLSLLALGLGIFMVHLGRKSAKIYWESMLLSADIAVWIVGIALVMENRSPLMTGIGITMTEIAINAIFPLVTCYQIFLGGTSRYIRKILWGQIFTALLISVLIFVDGYRGVGYTNGEISLVLIRTPAFYLALLFSIASILFNIHVVWKIMISTGYTRDISQSIHWIVGFSIGLIWLILRFYFPATYKYGCLVVVFLQIDIYLYSWLYYPPVTSTTNLAHYIYSLAKTPILVLTREGKILLVNNSALSFFEKPRAELVGMDITDILDFGNLVLFFSKTAAQGNRINRVGAKALNNHAACEIDITYIYDKYQEFYCAILIIGDITDKINLISELEEAKRRAEMANNAKSTFLTNTSHEIRTPMNAIIGMSELILREDISPEVYEYTMGIKQAGANLLSIINDILDFSKIESGRMEILPVHYYFRSVINDVINIIRVRTTEKSLVFVTNIDSALPNDLIGDEVRIRQVLLNLLGNAVKYTEQGFIKLSITVEENSPGKDFVLVIEVEDCGIGIKEEDLDQVFGEFIQVDMAANRGVEGTGLGLAITKRLCRAMGGDVTVRSVYGKGSVFTARIPQKVYSDECFAEVENPREQTVLLYEDRSISADSMCWSLDNLGVAYTLAATEEEFLEALRREDDPAGKKYAFIFAVQALYEKIRPALEARQIESRMVLLADYGSESGIHHIRFLAMPVHTLSIANVLNHKTEVRGYIEKEKPAVRFTAPSARILIVDDITTNLKVAQGLMLPYNMIIDTCLNGPISIDLVKQNKYDLVFMDHMMPGMDGIEATAAIRAWERSKREGKDRQAREPETQVPIVALTANAISGMKEMFLERGFNDYLAKPIEMIKLHEILEKWIPREKQIREKGPPKSQEDAPIDFSLFDGKNVPGIDLAAGMVRYKDGHVYLEILRSYFSTMPELLNIIKGFEFVLRKASGEELKRYVVTVHGIKGSSYQICANEAGKQAENLEKAAKAGDWDRIEAEGGPFIKTMEDLLLSLGELLAEIESKEGKKEEEKPQAASPDPSLLAGLLKACREYDITKMEEVLEELEGYSYEAGGDLVAWLRERLDNIDYEAILKRLEQGGPGNGGA
jgi:signal transduction histidine kinase/CheY-like chemotaxis protein